MPTRRERIAVRPARTVSRGLSAALLVLSLLPAGCRRMTEEEALESAREEVHREMQPEVDRRQREIEDLKRQISEAKARLAAQPEARQGKPAR